MNFTRYCVAATLSLAIHGILLLMDDEAKVFAMPAGNQSTSVSLNFVAQPQTVRHEQPVSSPAEPKQQSKPNTPKPEQRKPQEAKKVVKSDKPAPATQPLEKKTAPSSSSVVKEEPANQWQENKEPAPAPSRSGVTNQPTLVETPSFLSRPTPPHYPRLAQKRGIEGVALYEVWLDEHGRQIKQILLSSSGAQLLDQSALSAIKQWKFSPYTVNGQTMAHRVQIPVRFKLEG
ncbi:energy transducer TonB [Vibrio metschnikovii]|uniref:energy transducer TonB n=1 Tax=Vibrio metschnikovii TaxID=28172 RepID=UPI002A60F84A|nr:energy transducer TonB [Vibrio metschnikovii]